LVREDKHQSGTAVTVYFDPQIFLLQQVGGISKYFSELISQFSSNPDLGVRPVFYSLPMRLNRHSAEALGLKFIEIPRPLRIALFAFFSCAPSKPADLTHQTFYSMLYFTKSKPWVTTLYDMIPETHGDPKVRNPHLQKASILSKARHVISISEFSAATVRGLLKDFKGQIDVIPLAGGEQKGPLPEGHVCKKRLIFVGSRSGYKNGELALRALAMADANLSMTFVGASFTSSELNLIQELGIQSQVRHVKASDEELSHLYRESCALVFPSEVEGFGLPTLEAMALGVPVIAANNEINREVSGDAPFYFELNDEKDLAKVMRDLCSNQTLRAEKVGLGTRICESYSWYRTASLTAISYKNALAEYGHRPTGGRG
jgi:glycosyltransferase involved in cell wall biosynthesis